MWDREEIRFRLRSSIPFIIAVAIACAVGSLEIWIAFASPPPGQGINVPHQWTRMSIRSGICWRTGGYDENGRPWGTAVPKWYVGPPKDAPVQSARP